jgi:hypothetical protein
MRFAKKVVIAAELSDDMSEVLKSVRSMDFLKHSEVHLVHVFNTIDYGFVFGEFPLVYPVEADRKAISESVMSMLQKTSKEILPPGFEGKMVEHCLFSENPKSKFCEFVKESGADLVIVSSREKHGLFESSFAQYVGKHTAANLLVMKHK